MKSTNRNIIVFLLLRHSIANLDSTANEIDRSRVIFSGTTTGESWTVFFFFIFCPNSYEQKASLENEWSTDDDAVM